MSSLAGTLFVVVVLLFAYTSGLLRPACRVREAFTGGTTTTLSYSSAAAALALGSSSRTRLFLDLSDILDEESEDGFGSQFMEQLRKQMSNSLNASPREVTNRIKAFFTSRRSPDEIVSFKQYLQVNVAIMDCVNAILLVEGCNKSNMLVKDLVPWSTILDAMSNSSPLLTSSMISRGISCMRNMRPEDANLKAFLGHLVQRINEKSVLLSSSDICPAIYSVQTLSSSSQDVRTLLKYFAKSLDATSNVPGEPPLSSKSVCSALFGLKKMRAVPEVRALLAALTRKIAASEMYYHPVNVCIALNGLQSMDDSMPEVKKLLAVLMDKSVAADEQGMEKASDREMSMALFGLQRMGGPEEVRNENHRSDASPELRRVIRYLSSLMAVYDVPFEAKRLGFALMGLSSLKSDVPEVKELVSNLATKTATAWGSVNGQELSMCLHGLASLSSEDESVRRLVSGLVPLVKSCERWTTSDARSAFFGLQGLRSTSKEVNALVAEVCSLCERSNTIFSAPYEVATSLNGIQGLGGNAPEVLRLFQLFPKLMSGLPSDSVFEARDVSMSVYGLRSASSANPETLQLLTKLVPFIKTCSKTAVTTNTIASTLFGLQNMYHSEEVGEAINSIIPLVKCAQGRFNPRGLSMALTGIQRLDSKHPEVLQLIDELAALMERSEENFTGFDDFFQLSAAVSGLATMATSDGKEVTRLTTSLAKLIKSAPPTKKEKLLRNTPSMERVALALYGLQGMNPKQPSVQAIVAELVPFMNLMPPIGGKYLGMALQGFKENNGRPTGAHEEALAIVAAKMPGWSTRKRRGGAQADRGGSGSNSRLPISEALATLRSALWGVSKLDRKHPSVRKILVCLASEASALDVDVFDKRTMTTIVEIMKGAEIEKEVEVATLIEKLAPALQSKINSSKIKSNNNNNSNKKGAGAPRTINSNNNNVEKKWRRSDAAPLASLVDSALGVAAAPVMPVAVAAV